jgi:dihydrofolate reductase
MEAVQGHRQRAGTACEGRALIETVLIVAVAENGVIGAGGAIPWRLKSDMQRFKALTIGKPVVMGRKTFISLKRPLPQRTNIVMTRDQGFRAAGAVVTTSLEAARAVARGDALRRSATEIAVIGGADIYAQWMDDADRLEVTEVHAEPAGDTRLAPIDMSIWEETARLRHAGGTEDTAPFSYVTYRRRRRAG